MVVETDLKIIELLKGNGRMQWREIGEEVHLSGPGVANRIQRLEKTGVIKRFTVETDGAKMGAPIRAYITV